MSILEDHGLWRRALQVFRRLKTTLEVNEVSLWDLCEPLRQLASRCEFDHGRPAVAFRASRAA